MADWRARGYVADSDDEDDSQDLEREEFSHPTSSQHCLEHDNAPNGSQAQSKTLSANTPNSERKQAQGSNTEKVERLSQVLSETNVGIKNNRTGHTYVRDEPHRQTVAIDDGGSTPSSPLSLLDDGEIDELEKEHYLTSEANLKSNHDPLVPEQQHNPDCSVPSISLVEAISTSPDPEACFNPPLEAGRGLHETPSRSEYRESHNAHIRGIQAAHTNCNFNVIVEVPTVINHQQSLRASRNLRHRNPIQLHPYAIESEKYRQILKARGVKPLRIVQTQDESEAGHGEESQMLEQDKDEEAQDFEMSQNLHVSRSGSLSPLPEASDTFVSRTAEFVDPSELEGDEFPDVDTLLRAHHQGVAMNGFKRRKTGHTFSRKMQRLPQKEVSISSKVPAPREALDLFDTPVSPPPSSDSRPDKARSKMPKFKVPPGLSPIAPPTPVTSSEPRTLLPSDISEDEQSPLRKNNTIEDEQTEQSQLSDDSITEMQPPSPIQQAQRQIRGVLPASWLSLDRKTQKANSKKNRGFQSVLSGGGDGSLRGVARRKNSHKSASPSTNHHQPIILFDVEDYDSQSDRSDIATRTNVATAQTTPDLWGDNLGDDPMSTLNLGEVEEDNRIDEMLPTQRRKPTGTRQRRMKGNAKSMTRALDKHQLHSKNSSSHRKGYQPRITHQLEERRQKQPAFDPPRLSILDAHSPIMSSPASVPQFLKVALRTARFRNDKGRQSPTKKYLKFPTTKDTEEIDKTLSDWRNGRIRPRTATGSKQSRKPLTDLTGSNEILPPQIHNASNVALASAASKRESRASVTAKPKKLQQTLDQLIARNTISHDHGPKVRKYKFVPSQRNSKTIAHPGHVVSSIGPSGRIRPAALEGLQSDQERQRTRFQQGLAVITELSNARPKQKKITLTRKRAPRHLAPEENGSIAEAAAFARDAGDHSQDLLLQPEVQRVSSRKYPDIAEDDHIYPIQVTVRADATSVITGFDQINTDSTIFDIQPLPAGTRLDSTTFIGCGDFQRFTNIGIFMGMDRSRGLQTFRLRDGTFDLGYVISRCHSMPFVRISFPKPVQVIILIPRI